jgi:fructose-specific phosphotransferase system IIC component
MYPYLHNIIYTPFEMVAHLTSFATAGFIMSIVEGFLTVWIVSIFTNYINSLDTFSIIFISLLIGFLYYIWFELMISSVVSTSNFTNNFGILRTFLPHVIILGIIAGLTKKYVFN